MIDFEKIQDYLPIVIIYDSVRKKYNPYNPYSIYRIHREHIMILKIHIKENHIIMYYETDIETHNETNKEIITNIIYEGECNILEDLAKKSIDYFNNKIGNINDFVDNYKKRNITLLNL